MKVIIIIYFQSDLAFCSGIMPPGRAVRAMEVPETEPGLVVCKINTLPIALLLKPQSLGFEH